MVISTNGTGLVRYQYLWGEHIFLTSTSPDIITNTRLIADLKVKGKAINSSGVKYRRPLLKFSEGFLEKIQKGIKIK